MITFKLLAQPMKQVPWVDSEIEAQRGNEWVPSDLHSPAFQVRWRKMTPSISPRVYTSSTQESNQPEVEPPVPFQLWRLVQVPAVVQSALTRAGMERMGST